MNDTSSHPESFQIPEEDFHTLDAALYSEEKTAILIDGANCFSTIRALEFQLDWKKFYFLIHSKTTVMALRYYTALNQEDDGVIHNKKLLDFIEYNGYTMITKPAKRIALEDGKVRVKGNMDIEITLDAIEISKNVDHIVLTTGDGDFAALVSFLQRKGKKVSVISSRWARGAAVSDDLRRGATHFIDLVSFKDEVVLQRYSQDEE